ncbi:leucyl/phenylalanyl-tRNA--protein transferase [Aureimonas jatrophae]|uniref:Leucyl/phenylalanyl-tRNA--protein transferase n=1 Tax=Aureimonas jatrophae TaxID=1166073 RepID=A0A1H0MDE2_9HYPH|nr:leucyl/phenylalanyl-tRNA--protein transferase [Aureimonas jatrophae]MBB3951110.1 leucyl/phenylalanyl-tRNA--protein transferase [Aureimonas jatrophae]SDO78351.1 leucyl/phenylalanyl-tRNA--protein transferase [Aureimonas jatrophae]
MSKRGGEIEITPQLLLRAYAAGIFPMAENAHDPFIHWMDPQRRGILPLDGLHVPRSLVKTIRQGRYEVHVDRAFAAVVDACAEPAPGREQTWINAEIRRLYLGLYAIGHAHSVEAWNGDRLEGGLYGVSLGGAFFGESMFSRATDASKVALVFLWDRLVRGGYTLLDTQFKNDHLARFGAIEIRRADYRERLARAIEIPADFYPAGAGTVASVLQSLSQTS